MSAKDLIEGAVEHLQTSASVKTVYGEPIVTEGKTVIPVAPVAFGFGGGGGRGPKKTTGNGKATTQEKETERDTPEGEGAGGGVMAKPVGVVEITGDGTKFVPFGATKKLAITALVGTGVGLVLGMLLGRKSKV